MKETFETIHTMTSMDKIFMDPLRNALQVRDENGYLLIFNQCKSCGRFVKSSLSGRKGVNHQGHCDRFVACGKYEFLYSEKHGRFLCLMGCQLEDGHGLFKE